MTPAAERMRVLVVGFVESIHAIRAVEPMLELGWDVHVFASHPHWADPAWRNVTLHVDPGFVPPDPDPSVRVEYMAPAAANREPVVDGLSWRQRAGALAATIEVLRPGLVDSMEIQHGGYLMLEARSVLGGEAPPWLVHNWGSDVFYYGRNPRHLSRLRGVFGACDYYGAECHRDVGLARAFGFSGRALPVLPNTGGFDLERVRDLRSPGPTSARKTIALKAANTFVYRPETALAALELCGDLLPGHRLALYTASDDVEAKARELTERLQMELEIASKASALVSHDQILSLHGRSRISISLSKSDAICTSFLEAMVMGSFPIQSNTGCAAAWAEHGRGALFVDPEDVDDVAAALRRALADDALVDDAAESNAAVADARLDRRVLLARMMDVYERIEIDVSAARGARDAGLDPAAMAAQLPVIAAPGGEDSGEVGSELRREQLALLYLDPSEDSAEQVELLAADASGADREAFAADLLWVLERQAEQIRAERVGWPRGEVAAEERIDDWFDSELIERDTHIAALRDHVGAMQQSLDGFHRRLQESTANPPALSAARLRAFLGRLRSSARRRLAQLRQRSRGEG